MSVPNYSRFLSECIIRDPNRQPGLRDDEMYGVYLSWCFIGQELPASDGDFWAAMSGLGHKRNQRRGGQYVCPGLAMTGPAAVNYILASQPSLV